MKKSSFQTIAESIAFKSEAKLPTDSLEESRSLSAKEVAALMREELKKKDKVNVKVQEDNWTDAEVENQIDWVKALNLKEYFQK